MTRCLRYLPIAVAAVLLSGCGGGGGGGGVGDGTPPTATRQLQLSTTQVNFTSASGGLPPQPVELSGTVTGNPSAVFAIVAYTQTGIFTVSAPEVSGASARVQILPRSPLLLGPGTYRDTITVRACGDADCRSEYAGSPATVSVTYKIGLDVAPASLSVQAIEGRPPAPQTINASYYAGSANWTAAVMYTSGAAWLNVPASGSSLPAALNVAFETPPPGNYAASIRVATSAPGAASEVRNVPVSYIVTPLMQVGTVPDFSVTNQQGASGQTRNVTVASADTNRNVTWTASVDEVSTWLQLTTASGTTGGSSSLQMSLNAAEVAKLRNGRYVAQITVAPSQSGVSAITVPIVLVVDRTQVATVAPYVAASGHQAEVILRGTRFDDVTIQSVHFGATNATSFQLDGPTRIRAVHPALNAGRYPVTVVVAGASIDSSAELVVQDVGNYVTAGEAAAPIQFAETSEFDAERRTCYLASSTQVAALRAGGASWSPQVSAATFHLIYGMALSADGRELLVGDFNDIVHLDPVTLAETHRTHLSTTTSSFFSGNFARVDDGTVAYVVAGNVWSYKPWTHVDTKLTESSAFESVRANRTGNRLVAAGNSNATDFSVLDSMTLSQVLSFHAPFIDAFSSDRFGTRWAFTRLTSSDDTIVTDGVGAQIGQVPSSNATGAAVMSGDGAKLVLALGFNPLTYRTFDISPLATGGTATLLGSVQTTADYAGTQYLTPHEDEVVNCGRTRVSAIAVP